jgi:hypothetical protein
MMDCYKVHLDKDIRKRAKDQFEIQFLFVPSGLTDEWQPLDRAVFGVVKAISRRLYREKMADRHTEMLTRAEAAQMLMEAWGLVTPATLRRAWACYEEEPVE